MNSETSMYLDNAATTGIDSEVADAMRHLYGRQLANPASQHASGRQARNVLENAKDQILALVGARCSGIDAAQVIVTSGGTEANNLAVLGFAHSRPGVIIVSAIEHPSVLDAAEKLKLEGREVRVLPVDQHGLCDLELLEQWLDHCHSQVHRPILGQLPAVSLVSIMLGNNEIGTLQDLQAICNICHRYEVPVHTDGVQAVGKLAFSMEELGIDALTISAHKLHGPVGVGALVVRSGLMPAPLFFGGGQQLGVRPGTEPVVLVAGLAKALELSEKALEAGVYTSIGQLRDRFEQHILGEFANVSVAGSGGPRLPHISNLAFDGLERQAMLMALDLAGIQCSSGSACASGSSRPSRVLSALGVAAQRANGALRFSFSRWTTALEIELAAQRVVQVIAKMQKRTTLRN